MVRCFQRFREGVSLVFIAIYIYWCNIVGRVLIREQKDKGLVGAPLDRGCVKKDNYKEDWHCIVLIFVLGCWAVQIQGSTCMSPEAVT